MSCDSTHYIIVKNPHTREKVMDFINGNSNNPSYESGTTENGVRWISWQNSQSSQSSEGSQDKFFCSIDDIQDTENYLKVELSGNGINVLGCYLYENEDYFIYLDCDEDLPLGITNDYGREFFKCEVMNDDGCFTENINAIIEDCVTNKKWYHITLYDEFDASVFKL